MAARKTAPKPADEPESVVEHIEDICRRCWPNGWPHLSHSASCEHGTYVRDPEAAPPVADEKDDGAKTAETKTPDSDAKTEDTPPAGDKTEA